MNGLELSTRFAASKTPYAIAPDTFRVDEHGFGHVNAIWAGRKNGRTTAAYGELATPRATSVSELIDSIDMRYGGDYEGRWDDHTLVTQNPLTESRRNDIVALLAQALNDFPAAPSGYVGWYYRRSAR